MFNFFTQPQNRKNEFFFISGSDYNHIKNVLRLQIGDNILVSCENESHLCIIEGFDGETVTVKITEENYQNTTLPIDIFLFQGLPKSDKMELIIQKAVELGVAGIVPVEMARCVSKPDEKKKKSKQSRWQAIAESAAKQSKCTRIPTVFEPMSYKQALQKATELDLIMVPYESKDGMVSTKNALEKMLSCKKIGIFIGPEGGFEDSEISAATQKGAEIVSLGKRILRTETAAITALSMCMLHIEMNGDF